MFTSVFKKMFDTLAKSFVFLLIAMASVNYLPDKLFEDFPFDPKSSEPKDFDKVIPQWNSKLSDGQPEFIQLNNLIGPESIAIAKSGLIYTGLADGRLVELDPNNNYKMRKVLRFKESKDCPDNVVTKSPTCGRFLQLRFINNSLYAIEANSGLYKIDVKAGTKKLAGPIKPLNKINLYNSFAFDPKEPNLVYLTISSTKWDLLNIMWASLELDKSGQLVAFDIDTGKRVVILDELSTANGIDVDTKRDQLLFSQTMSGSITSMSLEKVRASFKAAKDGDKLGHVEWKSLIPLLPGLPDNIVVEGDLVYIALPFVKQNGKDLLDHLSTMPTIRKALSRFLYGVGRLLEYVHNNFFQDPNLETAYRELKCGHINYRLTKSDKSAVVEYNLATGASRFMGSDSFGFISEAHPDGQGNLYLGSFRSSFLVKQKI